MEADRTGQYNPGNNEVNIEDLDLDEESDVDSIKGKEIIFDGAMNSFFTDFLHLDPTEEKEASNAIITYNGHHKIENLKDNSYTLNGVTFDFHAVTDGDATINVQQDMDSTVSQITDFVEKYNEMIETINGKL